MPARRKHMKPSYATPITFLITSLLLAGGLSRLALAEQKKPETELPPELQGAKVYTFPSEKKSGKPVGNPVIYRTLSYQDINFERLVLNLYLSVKPVDRAANIRKIYFQDIRVNGVPVHLETFDQEFKLSKTEIVDLPAPLKCSFVFSDLESLKPVKEIVEQDKIRITGRSFIEVKLNALEKLALRTKQLVLPVNLDEEVPLKMFSDNPLLQTAASKILDTLLDPSTAAAAVLAKEHLAKLNEDRTLDSIGRSSVFLLYCEYVLRDPKTRAGEKFTQSGTAFVIGAEGKLLTAKRVVQPWKFDLQAALLMSRRHLVVDPNSYKLWAWPVGVEVLSRDGKLDFRTAFSTDKQTLALLKTAPDSLAKREYQDSDSGDKATLLVHEPGENDAALLQLVGKNLEPLAISDSLPQFGPDLKITLVGFPFGLSQAQANPQPTFVTATLDGLLITLGHTLNPGESGAPLLTSEGKVIAMAGGARECIPIGFARAFIK